MNTRCRHLVIWVAFLLLSWAAGCNSHDPKMITIRGTVFYNGAPLVNVTQGIVRYSPKAQNAGGREASGRIQPDGSFVMTTFQKDDGVVVGEYDITVSAYAGEELSREQTESGVRASGPRPMIPNKYLQPGTSGLSDSVAAGHSGFKKIELTDKS
jgi:hypothetical protein